MILIDMPMPKNCLDCPACNEYLTCAIPVNGRKWGENDVREYGNGRPDWCPLKEQEAHKFFVDESGKITPLPVVVRCKDCKHYRINTVYPGTNMIMKYCAKTGIAEIDPDWFCADGERK